MEKFLILRSILELIDIAYSIENKNANHNLLQRIHKKFCLFFKILNNIFSQFNDNKKSINTEKLRKKFKTIRYKNYSNDKPICIYAVEKDNDHNGAILGDNLVYYHLYKIKLLSEYYNVFPVLVSDLKQLNKKLFKHKDKRVRLIDIVAHGHNESVGKILTMNNCKLSNITKDCQIILDACSTANQQPSIATNIAQKNGVEVFACEESLFFSKPYISSKNNQPQVNKVAHGFCIYEPYWMKKIDKSNAGLIISS